MLLYNVIESTDNYLKTFGNVCQHYRDEPSLNSDNNNANFPINSVLYRFKQKIMG